MDAGVIAPDADNVPPYSADYGTRDAEAELARLSTANGKNLQ